MTKPKLYCAFCGDPLTPSDEVPTEERSGYTLHAFCAHKADEERAQTCGTGDHQWPADLGEDGAACERLGCNLAYDEWTED